jgi:FAD/FMN-containing dehydrogenase
MNGATDKEENLDALKEWVAAVQDVNAEYGLAPYGGQQEEAQEKLEQLKQQYDPDNIFHNNCMNINPN